MRKMIIVLALVVLPYSASANEGILREISRLMLIVEQLQEQLAELRADERKAERACTKATEAYELAQVELVEYEAETKRIQREGVVGMLYRQAYWFHDRVRDERGAGLMALEENVRTTSIEVADKCK